MYLKSIVSTVEIRKLGLFSSSHKKAIASLARGLSLTALFAATVAAGGCAALQPDPPEMQVEKRATAFVTALRGGEREEAFSYATPAYRSASSPARLAGRYAGMATWTDAVVSDVVCEAARCEVELMVTYQMMRPKMENTRPLEQVWIEVDGQWYLYP